MSVGFLEYKIVAISKYLFGFQKQQQRFPGLLMCTNDIYFNQKNWMNRGSDWFIQYHLVFYSMLVIELKLIDIMRGRMYLGN